MRSISNAREAMGIREKECINLVLQVSVADAIISMTNARIKMQNKTRSLYLFFRRLPKNVPLTLPSPKSNTATPSRSLLDLIWRS